MVRILAFCAFAALLSSPAFANNPGGVKQTDVTTTEVSKAAEFAVQQINLQSNSTFALILLSVVEASSQVPVASGMKYTVVVEVLPSTECRNDDELYTLCSCSVNTTNKPTGYKVEVWVHPRKTPSMELLSFKQVPLARENSTNGSTKAKTLTIASAISSSSAGFQQFLKTYTPSYCHNAVELSKRSVIFQDNMLRIKKIQEAEQGSAKYGVTKFADLTESEFRAQYTMPMGVVKPDSSMKQAPPIKDDDIPINFDWRDRGAVTAVKSVGPHCYPYWAFAATGNIEGQWAIKKGHLRSVSEQQLIDCAKVNEGCKGGNVELAYKQIKSMGGLAAETSYPYIGKVGKCHFNQSEAVVYINGSMLLSTDEAEMAEWLAANGPIANAIMGSNLVFYLGGIAHPPKSSCDPNFLNLFTLIVGYGVEDGEPYWIIKNSWGKLWGENGYFRVYRGDGTCGVNKYPTSSVVY